jgi:DNA-binding MarR family transcriptional regulator
MDTQAGQHGPGDAAAHALAVELRVLLGALKRRLRAHASPGDLSLSQIAVLGRLERDGPATVTALARAEGVRPQSMGATVAALEAAGMIAGAPDPADGRQTLLSLTPDCLKWIRANRAPREDWLFHAIRGQLSAREQETLGEAVALLRRIVDA